ncbi:DUF5657 family protein [Patescibacteria group bacterium]
MTPIENIFNLVINIQIWSVVKILYLFALGIYLVFAIMVLREVDLMNRTLKGVFNLPIKLVAWIHLIFAVLVFLLALIIL